MSYFQENVLPKIYFNHFKSLCKDSLRIHNSQHYHEYLESLKMVLEFLSNLQTELSSPTFKNCFSEMDETLPIEIVWFLHHLDILPIVEYLILRKTDIERTMLLQELTKKYLKNCSNNNIFMQTVTSELVISILNSDEIDLDQRIYQIKAQICALFASNLKRIEYYDRASVALTSITNHLSANNSELFSKQIFDFLVSSDTDVDWMSVLQQTVITEKSDLRLLEFIKIIVGEFRIQCLKMLEMKILAEKPVDRLVLDTFLNFMLENEESSSIKQFILVLLRTALKSMHNHMLALSFYIARKCCTYSQFINYSVWFSSSFSVESTRPLVNLETSTFFINFLSDLVLTDTPYYLKVHINKAPFMPQNCQYLFHDYVALCKSRLSSLNHSYNLGIFEHGGSAESNVAADVNIVLKHFERTGEVMTTLLEASIFRKNYYEQHFLNHLLFNLSSKSTVAEMFIGKLVNLGKIPSNLVTKYRNMKM